MCFALSRRMPLVASRFLETSDGIVDLATGDPVRLRRLPSCSPNDERAWVDACSRLLLMWHEDLPPLLDYGFTPQGRFEAYGNLRPGSLSADARAAITGFLAAAQSHAAGARAPVHLGMRLVVPGALGLLEEVLEDGRTGCPMSIACVAEPGAGATTFLRVAASAARTHGYVPICADVLERWAEIPDLIQGRSVLLLCDTGRSRGRTRRWFFRLATLCSGSHVMLQVSDRPGRASDVALRLDPVDPEVLAGQVHVYPAVDPRRLRTAAEASGGLPARFLARLRGAVGTKRSEALRVAEAHPAYHADDTPEGPEPEHPWRDLIADAVRLAGSGRSAAAERDLRQIAAAAGRRHIPLAAAAAEVELAYVLLTRGRTTAARDRFASCARQNADCERLAGRAALGLGYVQLLDANLEAAESAFRVCRVVSPVEAAVGLAWTLLIQGRDHEAERAVAPARESPESRDRARAATIAAGIALVRQDLPAAARAAAQGLTAADADGCTLALASMLLAAVHGRIGDLEAAERHGRRALAAARTARAPLLVLAVRVELIEARQACGVSPRRNDVDRLLRVAERVAPLIRGRILAVGSRAHPVEQRRAELSHHGESFVRATGARGLWLAPACGPGAVLASDTAALVGIHEASATPSETLRGVAEWLRERVNARAVVVCDAQGLPLARAGAQDRIAAAARVLKTRVAQPPWVSAEGLESAVVIRYANAVRGSLACRWPVSRAVAPDTIQVMTAASAVAGPAIALMSERAAAQPPAADGIVGGSRAVARLREQIARAGAAPFPVLIEGESGAGKELVARAIHRESTRRLRAYVAINCAALSDDLFESEVFGHARGAFTGAHAERSGLFEQAEGGTLFLDEVSELSARAQAKLLRVLQEGEVRRLGENHARRVDVRVIAASNRVLEEEATAGRFRRDLLFRVAVIRIAVATLRERRDDIPLLAAHYWEHAARRAGARSVLTPGAVVRLSQHDWPGNVRELQNVIAALAVQVPRGRVGAGEVARLLGPGVASGNNVEHEPMRLEEARHAFERQFIAAAIARCGGRHNAAARQLGITRQGLAKLLKRLSPPP